MKRNKINLLLFLILAIIIGFSPSITANGGTVLSTGAEVNINNLFEDIDYKLSMDELNNVHDTVNSYSNLKALDRDESDLFMTTNFLRNVSDLSYSSSTVKDAATWLVENNIYSRPLRVDLKKMKVDKLSSEVKEESELASKSDFMMMLYKAENGVISSNIASVNGVNLARSNSGSTGLGKIAIGGPNYISNYWDNSVDGQFGHDIINYVSPNVYELYLEQMLNCGLITANELGGTYGEKLKKDLYDENNEARKSPTGAWRKSAINYFNGGNGCLGYANTFSNGVVSESTVELKKNCYFTNERISTLEAMHYIAEYMRKYENISNTEADIIAYKYGLTEFAGIPNEYLNDIYYLVGAGIISFDGSGPKYFLSAGNTNNGDSSNYLTQSDLLDLMYRVANKGARFKFNIVQLSDAETTLKSMGYSRNDYTYMIPKAIPLEMSQDFSNAKSKKHTKGDFGNEVVEYTAQKGKKSLRVLSSISNLFGISTAYAAGNVKDYIVTKQFDFKYKGNETGNIYKYYSTITKKEYVISTEDKDGYLGNSTVKSELASELYNDPVTETVGDYEVYTVKFKISAVNKTAALKYVNQRIVHTTYSNAKHSISALTKVEIDGTESTLISQDSLKGLSDIIILHDRVLMNKKTKAKCLIQNSLTKASAVTSNTQYGYAIIGSQIISGEPIMIEGDDDSVYYNIKCILALLPESSYGTLGFGTPGKVNNTLLGISLHKEFTSTYTYGLLGQDESEFTYIRLDKDSNELENESDDSKVAMYNMTNLYKGMTSLSRTFEINLPTTNQGYKAQKVTFILDLAYLGPENVDLRETEYKTFDDLQLALTQAPTEEENKILYHYWRRNYAVSNALCNMLYGTKDKVYIRSGYFVPKLTVLLPKSFLDGVTDRETRKFSPYYFIFSGKADQVGAVTDTKYFKEINKFMAENFHVPSDYSEYFAKTASGNSTIDSWWTVIYGGKKAMKKQFELLLGNADDAENMCDLYTTVSATSVEIATADVEDGGSATVYFKTVRTGDVDEFDESDILGRKTTGTNTKTKETAYALLTDCNIIYRNISYPRTIAQSSSGGPILNVTYIDGTGFRRKIINQVRVLNNTSNNNTDEVTSSGYLRAKTKALNWKNNLADRYGAFAYSMVSNYIVLTPMFSPMLQCNSNEYVYLGQGSRLVVLNKNGAQAMYKKDKSGDVSSSASCIWKTTLSNGSLKNICNNILASQKNETIPKSSNILQPKRGTGVGTGKYVKEELLSKHNDKITADCYTVPAGVLEKYRGPDTQESLAADSIQVLCVYLYKDGYVEATYDYKKSADKRDRITPTIKFNKGYKSLYAEIDKSNLAIDSTKDVKIKDDYKEAHFFNCFNCYLNRDYYYINGIRESTSFNLLPYTNNIVVSSFLHKNLALSIQTMQDFYMTGLNDQVIKAMLAKNMKLTDVKDIQSGSVLHIGETVWVRKGEYWESYPIKVTGKINKNWKNALERPAQGDAFSNAACLSVLNAIWGGYSVTANDRYYLLTNYLDDTSVQIGTGYKGAIPTNLNTYTKKGLLCKPDNDITVFKYDGSSITQTVLGSEALNYKYVTLKFKFQEDKELKAMSINSTNSEYELMFDAGLYGNGADLAIFDDELDFKYDSDVQITVSAKDEGINEYLDKTSAEFKGNFVKTVAIDWYRWLRFFTLIASCYLFFMLWFSYFVLKRGIAYKFLETLAKPGFRNKGKGLDLVKLFTFGILNIDSEPNVKQMFTMTVILIVIDVIVGYIL